LPIRPTWQTSGSPPGRLHTFPILLAAGQDHSVVINDLKHMPGKLLTARWRRLASILASASVVAPKRRVSRMATVSPAVLVPPS
jgi:hypothetical protein